MLQEPEKPKINTSFLLFVYYLPSMVVYCKISNHNISYRIFTDETIIHLPDTVCCQLCTSYIFPSSTIVKLLLVIPSAVWTATAPACWLVHREPHIMIYSWHQAALHFTYKKKMCVKNTKSQTIGFLKQTLVCNFEQKRQNQWDEYH